MNFDFLETAESIAWWTDLDGKVFAEYTLDKVKTVEVNGQDIPIKELFTADELATLWEGIHSEMREHYKDTPGGAKYPAYWMAQGYIVGYANAKGE